jgi:hypothetical protein
MRRFLLALVFATLPAAAFAQQAPAYAGWINVPALIVSTSGSIPSGSTLTNPTLVNPTVTTAMTLTNGTFLSMGSNPAVSGALLRVPNNANILYARNGANNGDVAFGYLDTNNLWNIDPNASGILYAAKLFANLGTPANGAFFYCSDCTIAAPCAGAGTGAFAKRLNATWVCN